METILHKPNAIRGCRAAKRWTQDDLARSVERSRYTIIRLERGDTFVSLDTIMLVANALDLSLNDALSEEGLRKLAELTSAISQSSTSTLAAA